MKEKNNFKIWVCSKIINYLPDIFQTDIEKKFITFEIVFKKLGFLYLKKNAKDKLSLPETAHRKCRKWEKMRL